MTAGAGRTIAYNQENKPLTITFGGVTTTFVYDGEGTRLKKIAGSSTVTRYISKLYECDNGSCTRYVWANNARIATIAVSNGTVNYWHQDHLGSSAVITDGAGNKVETITYYPYGGTRTNVPGTPVNVPYKYTGQELDSTTGLYDYGARQYEPVLARFTSPDTIVPDVRDPQALNRYAYARNNPLLYIDPSGHEWEGFWEGCWFGCDNTPQPSSPPPPPSVEQVVSQYSLPSVNEYVTQTAQMAQGFSAPQLYGVEFNAAYQDIFGDKSSSGWGG